MFNYNVENFQSLRVRAHMQTGVISDPYLPIDGLLYLVACRQAIEAEHAMSKPGESHTRKGLGVVLPMYKANTRNDSWFYKASFAQWPEHTIEDSQAYSKRVSLKYTDVIDFGNKKPKIETARGRYKSYYIKVYYRHCLWIDWFVKGDKEEIEKLLQHLTHIGKKTSQGWGAVKEWQVTPWPEDWTIRDGQGELMRAIPSRKKGFLYGLRPSYWNPKHQFKVALPKVRKFRAG